MCGRRVPLLDLSFLGARARKPVVSQQARPVRAAEEAGGAVLSAEAAAEAAQKAHAQAADATALASLRVRTLASLRIKGSPAPPIVLKQADSDAGVTAAWGALKRAFDRELSSLLLHHKNHYSLIFALREWRSCEDGAAVREVLTARKGQRPAAWISWGELHRTLVSWTGYAIIEVYCAAGERIA